MILAKNLRWKTYIAIKLTTKHTRISTCRCDLGENPGKDLEDMKIWGYKRRQYTQGHLRSRKNYFGKQPSMRNIWGYEQRQYTQGHLQSRRNYFGKKPMTGYILDRGYTPLRRHNGRRKEKAITIQASMTGFVVTHMSPLRARSCANCQHTRLFMSICLSIHFVHCVHAAAPIVSTLVCSCLFVYLSVLSVSIASMLSFRSCVCLLVLFPFLARQIFFIDMPF